MTRPYNLKEMMVETQTRWDDLVPEAYRQEPDQMPSGAVGKDGYLHLDFRHSGDKTILHLMEKRTPLFAQKALYYDEALQGLPCVTMISTSGCILQGDRLMLSINVGENAYAHVTTQSATKVHSMDKNYGAQVQFIRLHENAYLEYIPDPLILHRNSRFFNDTIIEYNRSSTLIYSEVIIPGRRHHHQHEFNGFDYYSSMVTAKDEYGQVVFKEKILLKPNEESMAETGIMGEFQLFGTAFILTPRENIKPILEALDSHYSRECCYGVSTLPAEAGLIFKVLSNDSGVIKKHIREVWAMTRNVVLNTKLPSPFLWKQ